MSFSKLNLFILLFSVILLLNACKPTDETPITDYSTGVFITNEGAFPSGSGTVNHYDRATKTNKDDIFGNENTGSALGNTVQSMNIYNGKAYMVVNNANKIVSVDAKTFKNPEVFSSVNYPNYFLPIDKSRAYISEWGDKGLKGAIKMYDFEKKVISKTILTGGSGAGQMLKNGSFVWVVNNSGLNFSKQDSTIVIIDTASDSVVSTIKVGGSPNSIVSDANGEIWVLCSGGTLLKLKNNAVDLTFSVPAYSSKLITDVTKSTLYFVGGDNKVYQKDLFNFGKTPPSVFLSGAYLKSPYAIGFDPKTGYMYCGDAKDFKSAGSVYIIDPATKTVKDSTKVGIAPNGFLFQ